MTSKLATPVGPLHDQENEHELDECVSMGLGGR
jgi:hypothetical protein